MIMVHLWNVPFWGAEGAPILFSDLGLRMASCSYIYIFRRVSKERKVFLEHV